MSEENLDRVRTAFEAWNAGDIEGVRKAYHPEAVMRYHGDFPEPGPFLGRDAIVRQFQRLRDALDDYDSLVIVGDPLDAGDRVVTRFAWRGQGSGPPMDLEATAVYTIRGARILEADFFRDHHEALNATDLSA